MCVCVKPIIYRVQWQNINLNPKGYCVVNKRGEEI